MSPFYVDIVQKAGFTGQARKAITASVSKRTLDYNDGLPVGQNLHAHSEGEKKGHVMGAYFARKSMKVGVIGESRREPSMCTGTAGGDSLGNNKREAMREFTSDVVSMFIRNSTLSGEGDVQYKIFYVSGHHMSI
ncbi:MAG: hypothetical protein Q9203_001866 [Teloschistes exilis]